MNIATGSILNMAPAGHDWVIVFDYGHDDTEDLTCPVIGWATVISAIDSTGAATTSIQPAFLHQDMVWTPVELREFDHEVGPWNVRAREIDRPALKVNVVEPAHSSAATLGAEVERGIRQHGHS